MMKLLNMVMISVKNIISDISELNKFSYDLFNKVNDNVFKE